MVHAVGEAKRFNLTIAGLGAFPKGGRPASVWAGMPDAGELPAIEQRLVPLLEGIGLYGDRSRPWRPHVTLARIKSKPPPELLNVIEAGLATPFGVTEVRSVDLVLSELLPTGPKYTVADRVRLR